MCVCVCKALSYDPDTEANTLLLPAGTARTKSTIDVTWCLYARGTRSKGSLKRWQRFIKNHIPTPGSVHRYDGPAYGTDDKFTVPNVGQLYFTDNTRHLSTETIIPSVLCFLASAEWLEHSRKNLDLHCLVAGRVAFIIIAISECLRARFFFFDNCGTVLVDRGSWQQQVYDLLLLLLLFLLFLLLLYDNQARRHPIQ